MTTPTVATVRERPDLLPVVAEWMWHQWWRQAGRTLEQTQAIYAECVAKIGAPQTFVLLEGDKPVGTVTLAREDLEERPNLTPWLAGVFVVPERRGQGYFRLLLAAFENACRAASIKVAWLFTNTAEDVYLKTGWETIEIVRRSNGEAFAVMRRIIPSQA